MIDTHCHLNLPVFDADRQAVLQRSRQAGVDRWVVPAIRLADFPSVLSLREATIYLALGLHPLFLDDHPADGLAQLLHWVEQIQPVAIGEIGLDHLAPEETHPAQYRLFQAQLAVAQRYRLPVLLHVRKAHDPVLALLRRMKLEAGGIVHAFSGSLQQADHYLALGFKLGFGGVVTHPGARRIRQAAATLPESALVLETDAPDLPPEGYHGQRNEPAHLVQVVETLARLRQTTPEHIMAVTDQNAQTILRL